MDSFKEKLSRLDTKNGLEFTISDKSIRDNGLIHLFTYKRDPKGEINRDEHAFQVNSLDYDLFISLLERLNMDFKIVSPIIKAFYSLAGLIQNSDFYFRIKF